MVEASSSKAMAVGVDRFICIEVKPFTYAHSQYSLKSFLEKTNRKNESMIYYTA